MPVQIESTALGGDVVILAPKEFRDDRGFFMEVFREDHLKKLNIPGRFVQENHSGSVRGVVRGLHFQWDPPMGKLMRVVRGSAFVVAVDIRKGSPRLGKWFGVEASAENRRQVWAPAGFARGFCALSDFAEVVYLCTGTYNPAGESGIRWDDPAIGIEWPVTSPILSPKDASAQTLEEWLASPNARHFTHP